MLSKKNLEEAVLLPLLHELKDNNNSIIAMLERIALAIERLTPLPQPVTATNWTSSKTFIWQAEKGLLKPVPASVCSHVELNILRGIDHQRTTLLDNTRRFVCGFPANHALLWGARGTGKSTLVRAVHEKVSRETENNLILVEIYKDDLFTLPNLLEILADYPQYYLLFCDDLSFESKDQNHKSLKTVLDNVFRVPINQQSGVLFYATSNRRHLVEWCQEDREEIITMDLLRKETVEEKISLSDRFGLWIGFTAINQKTYLEIVDCYANYCKLPVTQEFLFTAAKQWAAARGNCSGRTAWQFIQELSGRLQHNTQASRLG